SSDLIYFDLGGSTKNLLIKDCYLENAQIDAIAIKKVTNCIVENNTFVDSATDFYSIASGVTVDRSSNLTIRKNYFIRTGNQDMMAINVFGKSTDIIIEENEITNMLRGINIDEAENIQIRNNRIVNSCNGGIRVEDAFKVLLESNFFETTAANRTAVFATAIRDLIIIANIIDRADSGVVVMHSSKLMVISNRIDGGAIFASSRCGLKLYNCTEAVVSKNQIMTSCYFGLSIYISPKINVDGNIISGSKLSGIYLWSSDYSVIQSNVIQSNGRYEPSKYERNGIDIADSSNCTIQKNQVFDNQTIKTQQFGLVEKGSSDYNIILLNDLRFNAIGAMKIVGTHTVTKDNLI
ncbi:MAG: nitrous oxide reductase family maturation protein NosD, partial [Asgard group archaeon]